MKIVDLGASSSVINCFMAQLRDVNTQTNRTLFRGNLRRIAHAMAYEVSRTLDSSVKNIQTPLAVKEVPTYDAAFLSAYREEGKADDIKIHIEYIAAPHLDGSTFLLVDPMLATGGSLELAYQAFLSKGKPAKLHICCVIASRQGIERLQHAFPGDDVTLWVAAIDPQLNDRAYIVPGLGDAGDLSFGEKQ